MTVNSFHVSTPRMMLKQSPECLIAHSSSHHSKMLWIAGNWKFPQKQHRRCPSHEILMRIISLSFLKHHQLNVLRFAMLSILIQNNNYSHTIQSSLSLVFHCYNLNVVKKRFFLSFTANKLELKMDGNNNERVRQILKVFFIDGLFIFLFHHFTVPY